MISSESVIGCNSDLQNEHKTTKNIFRKIIAPSANINKFSSCEVVRVKKVVNT